jgi:7-alpha-hydroxysteroid dehydrogenase
VSIAERFRLDGMVALVSGAGRGIGAACALALAEAGTDVAVLARTSSQLDTVAERARALGRRALAVPTDADDADAVHGAVERTAGDLGRLDVVVSVVGGSMPKPFMQTSDGELRRAFEHNVVSGVRLVRQAIPALLESAATRAVPGSIVMISSAIGHLVARGFVAYGTAKAALDHAVRLIASDASPRLRVNGVAPGAILTDALDVVARDPAVQGAIESGTPLRRLGEPDDVAAAVLYLASPASSYVTGQILAVDGGLHAPNLALPIPDL